jgi:hypothetical protein
MGYSHAKRSFQLASEPSGESFAKHMSHGTSTLLALAGPTRLSTSLRQMLFDAFRTLEANRAILFGDDTFLSQPIWALHHAGGHSLPGQKRGHLNQLDTIFDLKVRVCTFCKRYEFLCTQGGVAHD